MQLIEFSSRGLFCPAGNFYIDPWQPVEKAVITHAHSDHAYPGSGHYLCHPNTFPLLRLRLGDVEIQTLEWGEEILINGVRLSLHPAGHIIGSSQDRLEYRCEVWLFSGDYKREDDGMSGRFEPQKCHRFITESTFGLPIYAWKPQEFIYQQIHHWIGETQSAGRVPVITGYSLGKAQRIISCLRQVTDRIYAHGAVANVQEVLVNAGLDQTVVRRVTPDIPKREFRDAVVVAPPGVDGSPWLNRFEPFSLATCSGWMQVRGNVRRRNVDAGFVLSDHADWQDLLKTVNETGAEKVYVTHGFQESFSRYLNESGIDTEEIKTAFKGEELPGEETENTNREEQA